LPHDAFFFWIAWRRRNEYSPPASVAGEEITLQEGLANVDLIHLHIVRCCQCHKRTETACMWHGAESVSIVYRGLHVLALADKAHFELIQRLISIALDFVVEAALEDLVNAREIRSPHAFDTAAQGFYLISNVMCRRGAS